MSTRPKVVVMDGARRGGGGRSGGGAGAAGDWRADLVVGRDNEVKPTAHNLMLILKNDEHLAGLFAMNAFENRIALLRTAPWGAEACNEYRETDGVRFAAWLGSPHRYRMSPKLDLLNAVVLAVAEAASFHPVREYLDGLAWDGIERIPTLFRDAFGVPDSDYARHVARAFFVSAVARICQPGCQVDFMLVLEGDQGAGKTRAVNALFGDGLYAEAMESPQHKDFYIGLQGKWGIEIGEMHAFSKADVTKVKQAVTARADHYRPPYARTAQSFPRQCVLIGTTNETDWQRDPTGARRYYPLRVGERIDLARLREQRDQLWAEAVMRYKRGDPWWETPPGAGDEQEERYQEDSWIDPIARWLDGLADERYYPTGLRRDGTARVESVSTAQVLYYALGMEWAKHTRAEQNRIGPIMRRLGWEGTRLESRGRKLRVWVRRPPF